VKASVGPATLQRQPRPQTPRTSTAPNARPHDSAQETSWVNLHAPDGHVAAIYFATNDFHLDDNDRRVLSHIYNTYNHYLSLRRVTLLFVGYADYRGSESYNTRLGLRRAEAVAAYFSPLQLSPNYPWGTSSAGESEVPQIGSTSVELSPHRRVDIIASPIVPDPPVTVTPEPAPQPDPRSSRWKCRIRGSAGGGIVYGGSFFGLEVGDLTNHLRMFYTYHGGALTLGPGLSGGLSGASPGTDWQNFTTSVPIRIQDFKGPARHTSAGAQFIRGVSFETIHLFGPAIHHANPVYLGWYGLWEEGYSLGGGTDIGPLEPVTSEPDHITGDDARR
jgi:outer membrane protein OmpA-like peptidoglycan-associated protein